MPLSEVRRLDFEGENTRLTRSRATAPTSNGENVDPEVTTYKRPRETRTSHLRAMASRKATSGKAPVAVKVVPGNGSKTSKPAANVLRPSKRQLAERESAERRAQAPKADVVVVAEAEAEDEAMEEEEEENESSVVEEDGSVDIEADSLEMDAADMAENVDAVMAEVVAEAEEAEEAEATAEEIIAEATTPKVASRFHRGPGSLPTKSPARVSTRAIKQQPKTPARVEAKKRSVADVDMDAMEDKLVKRPSWDIKGKLADAEEYIRRLKNEYASTCEQLVTIKAELATTESDVAACTPVQRVHAATAPATPMVEEQDAGVAAKVATPVQKAEMATSMTPAPAVAPTDEPATPIAAPVAAVETADASCSPMPRASPAPIARPSPALASGDATALRQELAIALENIELITEDNSMVRQELSTAQAEYAALKEQHDAAQELLDSAKGESERLNESVTRNVGQLTSLTSEVTELRARVEAAEGDAADKQLTIEALMRRLEESQERMAEMEEARRADERLRKQLHNTIQELKGNIRVFCRVRPLLGEEAEKADEDAFSYVFPTDSARKERGLDIVANNVPSLKGEVHKEWSFNYDRVFGPQSSQEDVFDEVEHLVQSALDGYKVCIFAYGQTGSGKTFTMEGDESWMASSDSSNARMRGIIPRAVEKIFSDVEEQRRRGWDFELKASYLQIYNEQINDLLSEDWEAEEIAARKAKGKGKGKAAKVHKGLEVRLDAKGGLHVPGLTIQTVEHVGQVQEMMALANKHRTSARTNCNERSSRSHSVFQLRIVGRAGKHRVDGMLNLIDLAGSERLSRSGAKGDRLKETQAINKSLSALSDVISAIASANEGRQQHVPFRNSVLTRLLQPSLGGDCKTLMFLNVDPSQASFQESLCSMRFGERAQACHLGTAKAHSK